MTVVLNWLAQQTLPIYIVSFLGVAAYVAAALAAQRRQRLSQFSWNGTSIASRRCASG
jgi:hypothetical protein